LRENHIPAMQLEPRIFSEVCLENGIFWMEGLDQVVA